MIDVTVPADKNLEIEVTKMQDQIISVLAETLGMIKKGTQIFIDQISSKSLL